MVICSRLERTVGLELGHDSGFVDLKTRLGFGFRYLLASCKTIILPHPLIYEEHTASWIMFTFKNMFWWFEICAWSLFLSPGSS